MTIKQFLTSGYSNVFSRVHKKILDNTVLTILKSLFSTDNSFMLKNKLLVIRQFIFIFR